MMMKHMILVLNPLMIYQMISNPFQPPHLCILIILHAIMVALWTGPFLDKVTFFFMAGLMMYVLNLSIYNGNET